MRFQRIRSLAIPLGAAAISAAAIALPAWGEDSGGGDGDGAAGDARPAPGPGEFSIAFGPPDEVTDCLEENGIEPPAFDPGDRPQRPSAAQRRRFEQALTDCGLPTPPHGAAFFAGGPPGLGPGHPEMVQLTDEELEAARNRMDEFRTCMSEQGVDLPEPPAPPELDHGEAGRPHSFAIPLPRLNSGELDEIWQAEDACGGPPEIVITHDR